MIVRNHFDLEATSIDQVSKLFGQVQTTNPHLTSTVNSNQVNCDMALRMALGNSLKGLVPNLRSYAPTLGEEGTHTAATKRHRRSLKEELLPKGKPLGNYVPVYVALGMISLSLSLGLYTAKQELLHGPDVRVKKSRRETLPEVVEPEYVAREAEDFVKKSVFRKVAHIQDQVQNSVPNPIRSDRLSM